jgi:arsenate reductase-like glutaredoxin family protein
VDLSKGLTEAELNTLIGDRDHKLFLNPRNELYREMQMKESPPSRQEAVRLMAKHPNLIRRPILVKDKEMALGWDREAMAKLL